MATVAETRFFDWYVENVTGDGTSQGPTFIADRDYRPEAVRVHASVPPDAGDMAFDILDDGVSIFTSLPTLRKGNNSEEVAEDFDSSANTIKKYSLISLNFTSNAGKGITVQLELVAEEDDDVEQGDT